MNNYHFQSFFMMAKVFNGRAATEEYMSTHSLTFSTPEMTLRKYALWLGETVNLSGDNQGPRLLLYIEEKGVKKESELAPDTDDSFKPTGAVTEMYGAIESAPTDVTTPPQLTPLERATLEPEAKFCIICGNKLKANAKFCTKCGSAQG
jgi:zinc-ribbon domain